MSLRISRTLPAVGHKMPLKALLKGWFPGRVGLHLGLFKEAAGIIYTSSGSAALVVALRACSKVSSRRKVIIPAYTCPSVLAAVEASGLEAVLCDLAPGTLGMDEHALSRLIGEDTLAVIYVHLFGLDIRSARVAELAGNAGAWLIEDAAQAFGNHAGGLLLGSDGDLAVLSFGRGKPLSALHGGAVVIHNTALAESVRDAFGQLAQPLPGWFGIYYRVLIAAFRLLFDPRWFGLPQALPWLRIGETYYNDRVPVHGMAAAAGRVLKALLAERETIQKNRARVAASYLDRLRDARRLFDFFPEGGTLATGALRFPLVFKRKELRTVCLDRLSGMGLGATGSYPVPLNLQAGVPEYVAAQGPFPNAQRVADGILTLPTHEYVTNQDVALITSTILELER